MRIRVYAETMVAAGRSIGTVVTTWTLCTIPQVTSTLREMRRVLRPEGSLLLVEMGLRRTARGRMVAASPKHHVGNASAVAVISTAVRHPDRSAPRFGWRFAVATQEHLCQVKF